MTCQVINCDTLNGLDDIICCPNFDANKFVYGDSSTPTTEATALWYWRFNSAMGPEFFFQTGASKYLSKATHQNHSLSLKKWFLDHYYSSSTLTTCQLRCHLLLDYSLMIVSCIGGSVQANIAPTCRRTLIVFNNGKMN